MPAILAQQGVFLATPQSTTSRSTSPDEEERTPEGKFHLKEVDLDESKDPGETGNSTKTE